MHSDSAVLTGSAHARIAQPAQDHALHRDADGRSWGIVADGCSGGGRTDLGARLWTLALDERWRRGPADLDAALLREIAPPRPAGVEPDDLLATLVAVVATGEAAAGYIAGDGALLALKSNGERLVIEHRFSANLPAYPAYLADTAAHARFRARCRAESQLLEVITTRLDAGGARLARDVEQRPIDDALQHACRRHDFTAEGPLQALLAISDGFGSRPRTDWQATLVAVSTLVNPVGRFLRRRLGLLGQRWSADRSAPADDLSVAGICWPEHVPKH